MWLGGGTRDTCRKVVYIVSSLFGCILVSWHQIEVISGCGLPPWWWNEAYHWCPSELCVLCNERQDKCMDSRGSDQCCIDHPIGYNQNSSWGQIKVQFELYIHCTSIVIHTLYHADFVRLQWQVYLHRSAHMLNILYTCMFVCKNRIRRRHVRHERHQTAVIIWRSDIFRKDSCTYYPGVHVCRSWTACIAVAASFAGDKPPSYRC